MLTEGRQAHILHLLEDQEVVKVQDLVRDLEVSESTVRRDLSELEAKGALFRVHGGAKRRRQLSGEPSYQEKEVLHLEDKGRIAHYAASLVQPDSVIYLDAGTSTYAMIPYLQEIPRVRVVTNGYHQAQALLEFGIEPYLLGGRLRLRTHASVGTLTQQQLRHFHFDQVFLGMNAVDPDFGYSTPDPEEAAVKRMALDQADQAYVLVDPSKFNHRTFTQVAPLATATIITRSLSAKDHSRYSKVTRIEEIP